MKIFRDYPRRLLPPVIVMSVLVLLLGAGRAAGQEQFRQELQNTRQFQEQLRELRELRGLEGLRNPGALPGLNGSSAQPWLQNGWQPPAVVGQHGQLLPQTESLRQQSETLLQRLDPQLARRLSNFPSAEPGLDRLSQFRVRLEEHLQLQDEPERALRLTAADFAREGFSLRREGLLPSASAPLDNREIANLLAASGPRQVTVGEYHEFLRQVLQAEPGTPVLEQLGPDGFPFADARYFSIIGTVDIHKMIIGDDGIAGVAMEGSARMAAAATFGEITACDVGATTSYRIACPGPSHAERLQRMAGAVALVTEAGFVRRSGGDMLLDLLPAEHCKFQSRSHCSGFLDVDRRHVWTAAHCLANLHLIDTPGTGRSELPDIGETIACPPGAGFRAVFGLAARIGEEQPLAPGSVYGCRAVTRTSHDTVKVQLDTDTDVPQQLAASGMPVYSAQRAAGGDIPPGTRLAGFGFPHTARLAMLANGAVHPSSSCTATISSNSSKDRENPLPIDSQKPEADYLCISTDTLSGASGGPVLAALPDGEVAVVGIVSRAYRVELAEECKSTSEESDRLNLASRIFPLPR